MDRAFVASELCASLRLNLYAAGLIPDSKAYQAAQTQLWQMGTAELYSLTTAVGHHTWGQMLDALKLGTTRDDCARVLGFGYIATMFAIAPLPLKPEQRKEVASLGALANFIVSVFDKAVDIPSGNGTVLPRWMLSLAHGSIGRVLLRIVGIVRTPLSRSLCLLISEYFRRIDALPLGDQHACARRCLGKAIERMYDAELKTLGLRGSAGSDSSLRRKSSLPFVVMGLPAWIVTHEVSPDNYRWHMRWLYKLGNFIGWIDDATDIDDDRRTGHPNRAESFLDSSVGQGDGLRVLTTRIAQVGSRVFEQWRQRTEHSAILSEDYDVIFCSSVAAWLGGPLEEHRRLLDGLA